MVFADETVCLCAESHYNVSQHTVVHVKTSLPEDLSRVDSKSISLLNMVVKKCCQQVVRCRDRMEITGKMKV